MRFYFRWPEGKKAGGQAVIGGQSSQKIIFPLPLRERAGVRGNFRSPEVRLISAGIARVKICHCQRVITNVAIAYHPPLVFPSPQGRGHVMLKVAIALL